VIAFVLLFENLRGSKRLEKKKTRTERTWYGMTATVSLGPGFWHEAGLGSLIVPHPPLINRLLRHGLPEEARTTLAFAHEFGHLQSAPVFIAYTALMVILKLVRDPGNVLGIIFTLISAQAAWEIGAEILSMAANRQQYHEYYAGIILFPRLIFWSSMVALAILGWLVALS
jgi:hypothetical protein